MTMTNAPKPPPRLLKSARLLKQQQQQQLQLQQQQSNQLVQQQQTANNKNIVNNKIPNNDEQYPAPPQQQQLQNLEQLNTQSNNESMSALSINNMPKLSALMNTTNSELVTIKTETTTTNYSQESENILPKLSALNNSSARISQTYEEDDEDDSLNSTPSLIYTKPNCEPHQQEQQQQQHHSMDLNSIPVVVLSESIIDCKIKEEPKSDNDTEILDLPAISALNLNGERDDHHHPQHESNNLENVPSVALNFVGHRRGSYDECAVNDEDLNIPCLVANMNYNDNSSRHHLESIEEDYNGIEHEQDNDVELEDDEDSIPNLSFLDNRSSNNESSLTSVTNTSGDNSFEQSVADCSSTSTDNVPCLAVLNQ